MGAAAWLLDSHQAEVEGNADPLHFVNYVDPVKYVMT
jgi:hypothetical protein